MQFCVRPKLGISILIKAKIDHAYWPVNIYFTLTYEDLIKQGKRSKLAILNS